MCFSPTLCVFCDIYLLIPFKEQGGYHKIYRWYLNRGPAVSNRVDITVIVYSFVLKFIVTLYGEYTVGCTQGILTCILYV